MKITLDINEKDIEILNRIKEHYEKKGIDLDRTATIRYCIHSCDMYDHEINNLTNNK